MRSIIVLVFAGFAIGADGPKDDAAKKELALLEGEWGVVSIEQGGMPLPEMYVKGSKRICKDSELTVIVGGEVYMKAKCSVDPSKKPKTIDYVVSDGPYKGQTLLGIYEIADDTMKTCFAAPGKDRPTGFATKVGDGLTLSSWKKEKK
jgi:uncharacterized protein (TIGR03067 family)